ncbi:MAG: S8 family serine peptidase [Verrucomicrobiota bacterium]
MKKLFALVASGFLLTVLALLIFTGKTISEKPVPSDPDSTHTAEISEPVTGVPPQPPVQLSREDAPFPDLPPNTTRSSIEQLVKGATVKVTEDSQPNSAGRFIRRTLYGDANFHYRSVLVEEVFEETGPDQFQSAGISAIVGDHAMIRLPKEATEPELTEWIEDNGFRLRSQLETAPIYIVATDEVSVRAVDNVISSFQQTFLKEQEDWDLRGVAEADHLAFFTATPDDIDFNLQWSLENTGQFIDSTPGADIEATIGWNAGTGSSDVIVAVIDSGMQLNHPDLAGNLWTNQFEIPDNGIDDDNNGFIDDVNGFDFVGDAWDAGDSLNPDNDPTDQNGHGTHVAGTVGAVGNNATGVTGVNWAVSIIPLKIGGAGRAVSFSAAIEATNYAVAQGVDVMNNSYGGVLRPEDRNPPILFEDAIRAAGNADILFVAASGNDASDNDSIPQYPASYTLSNIVSVAATDWNDEIASFSNTGAVSVDIAAPGDFILSTVPGNNYSFFSGTSMASPHVAGALALLKATEPAISGQVAKSRLLSSAERLSSLSGEVASGGRLDLQALLRASGDSGGTPPSIGTSLAVSSMVTSDTLAVSPHNNGDGIFNPGELMAMSYTITNISDETVHVIWSDIEATFSELFPGIRIGFDSLSFGNRAIGSLAPGRSVTDSNLRLFCYGNTPVPFTGSYTITLESGLPNARSAQSFTFTAGVGNSVRISGTVLTFPGGVPLADATVTLEGNAANYTTTSDANGNFSVRAIGDTYTISATIGGFEDDNPFSINASSGASGVELLVDVPFITVLPDTISASVPAGDTSMETVSIGNVGFAETFFAVTGDVTGISTLPEGTPSIDPLLAFPSWLSVDPVSGIVPSEDVIDLTLTFSPASTDTGTLTAEITVTTADPINPEIVVPVSMIVTGGSTTGFPVASYQQWLREQTGDAILTISDPIAPDLDNDGLPNLIDFALADPDGSPELVMQSDGDLSFDLTMREDVPSSLLSVLASENLTTWTVLEPETGYSITETVEGDGTKTVSIILSEEGSETNRFYRLQLTE